MGTIRTGREDHKPLRIVIAGGGTGGHLFPAIAVAQEFMARQPHSRVRFISTGNAFERSALARAGFPLHRIASEGIKGRGTWQKLRAASKVPVGLVQAMGIIKKFTPHLVLGVGSYASGAVVLGARLLGIPVVLHEQNVVPGITNRLLAPLANLVCVSFEKTRGLPRSARIRVTGNPVRREFIPEKGGPGGVPEREKNDTLTVMIVGGSQGARAVNSAVLDALHGLDRKGAYRFIHQTGQNDLERVRNAYASAGVSGTVAPFFNDLADRYRTADLVICRAGATTIAEVTALGKAAIFIPFPHAADGHQARNARTMADQGAAGIIEEEALTGERLRRMIEHFNRNRQELADMGASARKRGYPHAAADIVDACYGLVAGATEKTPRRTA